MTVIAEALEHSLAFQPGTASKDAFAAEMRSWAYGLENVPTRHLDLCFERAIRSHTGPRPILASDVLREYEALQAEIVSGFVPISHDPTPVGKALSLPPSTTAYDTEYMTPAQWKEKHDLPGDWQLGQPYPPWTDLLDSVPPVPEHGAHANYGMVDRTQYPAWREREKAPWELYPDKEHPKESVVVVERTKIGEHGYKEPVRERVTYAWWVERCVEIDFPGVVCPGYVVEHFGPGGGWVGKLPCPMHAGRQGRE